MLACQLAHYNEKKVIECTKTKGPCGHVFWCELSMKWKQTEQAFRCPLGKEQKKC